MATTSGSPQLPQSLSRYRTLRGKSISTPGPVHVFRDEEQRRARGSPIEKRRSRSVSSIHKGPLNETKPNVPPLPLYALTPKTANIPPPPTFKTRDMQKRPPQVARVNDQSASTRTLRERPSNVPSADSNNGILHQEQNEDVLYADEISRLNAETDRILAEQKKLELARAQTQTSVLSLRSKRPILEKLSIFSRNKKSTTNSPDTPFTINTGPFSPSLSRDSRESDSEPSVSPETVKYTETDEKGSAVGMDVPLSAINGGERRVTVHCMSSTISLPVTIETTPVDILSAAAEELRHPISPASCVLTECYYVLGLERRVRRYERIRDVLNSWDQDCDNSLLILPSTDIVNDRDLDIGHVSRSPNSPPGFTLQLYHSSQPGKWSKRWVTLQENGQMVATKRPDSTPSDKDFFFLCHLTDFDIYLPKENEARNTLKPPKKFCYAIKSQQKTVAFPDGDNFVHFFSTEDDLLASRFYQLVHGWRSWHLVSRHVRIEKTLNAKAPQLPLDMSKGTASEQNDRTVANMPLSPTATSYRIGAFEPLLDMNGFDKLAAKAEKLCRRHAAAIKQPVKESEESNPVEADPEPETPMKLLVERKPTYVKEFFHDGLLGASYDEKREKEGSKGGLVVKVQGPFIEGPTLLNSFTNCQGPIQDKPAAKSWFPSATEHTARVRTESQNRRPMTADPTQSRRGGHAQGTLLNFRGHFPEPPHHRDGHGYGHNHAKFSPSGGPLINMSNGAPLPPPPRGLFSRSGTGGFNQAPPPVSRTRSRSNASQRKFMPENCPPMPQMPERGARRDNMPKPPPSIPPPEIPRGKDPRPKRPLIDLAR